MDMFSEIRIEIERRRKMFHWFVDGLDEHGISWEQYDYLTPDYVDRLIKMRKPRPIDTMYTLAVHGAACICSKNKTWDGKELYDIEDRFPYWMVKHIKERLK